MRGVYNIRVRAAVDQGDPGYLDSSSPRHEQDRHEQERAQKRRSLWWTVAIAAGVGAVGYLFVWPVVKRKFGGPSQPPAEPEQPVLAEPPAPTHAVSHVAQPIEPTAPPTPTEPYLGHDLEQEARSRGFSSAADYENSVLLNARELRRTGTAVTLAPHLAHLAPKLYGP